MKFHEISRIPGIRSFEHFWGVRKTPKKPPKTRFLTPKSDFLTPKSDFLTPKSDFLTRKVGFRAGNRFLGLKPGFWGGYPGFLGGIPDPPKPRIRGSGPPYQRLIKPPPPPGNRMANKGVNLGFFRGKKWKKRVEKKLNFFQLFGPWDFWGDDGRVLKAHQPVSKRKFRMASYGTPKTHFLARKPTFWPENPLFGPKTHFLARKPTFWPENRFWTPKTRNSAGIRRNFMNFTFLGKKKVGGLMGPKIFCSVTSPLLSENFMQRIIFFSSIPIFLSKVDASVLFVFCQCSY